MPRPGPVRIRIGVPLRFREVPDDPEGWTGVAGQAEAAVAGLAAAADPLPA